MDTRSQVQNVPSGIILITCRSDKSSAALDVVPIILAVVSICWRSQVSGGRCSEVDPVFYDVRSNVPGLWAAGNLVRCWRVLRLSDT